MLRHKALGDLAQGGIVHQGQQGSGLVLHGALIVGQMSPAPNRLPRVEQQVGNGADRMAARRDGRLVIRRAEQAEVVIGRLTNARAVSGGVNIYDVCADGDVNRDRDIRLISRPEQR